MRLLLIEDDDTIREELSEGLRLEGFDVETAADGQHGLLAASDGHYDAIILDLLLPRMNGYRVLTELRRHEMQTPVLILTAKTGEHDVAELLAAGADDFVSKPFRFVELVARLNNIIGRRRSTATSLLTVADLTVDPTTRVVTRRATVVRLTPTEYRILERLMVAKPAIVTHQEFLDEIWDPADPPDPNIVQLYIGYIRRKIDQPFGTDTIATVRATGYRINE